MSRGSGGNGRARAAWRAAAAIRADLARGYALHRVDIPVTRAVPCSRDGARALCLAERETAIELPVPIDRAARPARLAALEARTDRLRPAAMAAAPCGFGDRAGSAAIASGR